MKTPEREGRTVTEESNIADMIDRLNKAITAVYQPNSLCEAMAKVPDLAILSSQLRTRQLGCIPVLREAVAVLQDRLDARYRLMYNVDDGAPPAAKPKKS